MERFSALLGFLVILAIAFALSNNKRAIRWKTVFWGLLLQIVTAIMVLKGDLIQRAFGTSANDRAVAGLIFVVVAIVVYQVAKRMQPGSARRGRPRLHRCGRRRVPGG